MQKAIIFDCDGVLRTFSWRGVYQAYCVIGEYFDIDFVGLCPDVDTFRARYSHDWRRNMRMMGIYDETQYPKVNEMFAWVPEIFEQLSCEYIVTVYSNSAAKSVIDSLGIAANNCAAILGHDEVKELKPKPEGILKIMEMFNLAPQNTIMVGDADVDIMAGQNAGVNTALVTWGAVDSKDEINSISASKVLHTPRELLTLFDE